MTKQTSQNNIAAADAPSAPKNIFLHLFAFIALYISAVSSGSLFFGYIDRWFPDRLAPYLQYDGFSPSLRWSIASLIIVYPLYLFAQWHMKREFSRYPMLAESRIRKWLTYFTLFIAAVIMVTDLITLLYNFLGGEISIRFILKVLTALFIAGVIFAYYLFDIRGRTIPYIKIFAGIISALVLFSIAYGFFIVGSPQTQRMRRFDQERSRHLQQIYYQVRNFWDTRYGFPATLEDIKKLDPFTEIPHDPITDTAYEYRVLAENSFELCANFSFPSQKLAHAPARDSIYPYDDIDKALTHTEGKNCFNFTLTRVPKEIKDALR